MNSKGKQLARWGIVLQCGFLIGHLLWVILIVRAFLLMGTGVQPSQALATRIGVAIYVELFASILFILSAVLLLIALFKMKYRAPWFKTALWIISVLWLFGFPIGTVLGIIVMVYLNKHGAEFMKQVEPPALGGDVVP